MTFLTVFEHAAVALGAVSGVLAAAGKRIDLLGACVLALVTAFGGSTVRDLLLGDTPVRWVRHHSFVIAALSAALFTFFAARRWTFSAAVLQAADAVALSVFTIMGAARALHFPVTPAGPFSAVVLGVISGTAGGILRDIMANEIPLIFRTGIYLYATAAFAGASVYVFFPRSSFLTEADLWAAGVVLILLLRLAAIRWKLALPVFETRPDAALKRRARRHD